MDKGHKFADTAMNWGQIFDIAARSTNLEAPARSTATLVVILLDSWRIKQGINHKKWQKIQSPKIESDFNNR